MNELFFVLTVNRPLLKWWILLMHCVTMKTLMEFVFVFLFATYFIIACHVLSPWLSLMKDLWSMRLWS